MLKYVCRPQVCDTYPSELFVPKSATPAIIVGSSRFRSRGRFPVLSYFHQDTLVSNKQPHEHMQMVKIIIMTTMVRIVMTVMFYCPKGSSMPV